MEVAAFWAADTHEEKKLPLTFLEPGGPPDVVGVLFSSIVGVSGGTIDVDSLLF